MHIYANFQRPGLHCLWLGAITMLESKMSGKKRFQAIWRTLKMYSFHCTNRVKFARQFSWYLMHVMCEIHRFILINGEDVLACSHRVQNQF